MNSVKLTEDKLNVEEIMSLVSAPDCGAISIFVGTTRDNFYGKSVVRLSYEAHISMAQKELYKICQEIRNKWEVKGIAVFHRLGDVPVQEASVVIAISSPHRKEAMEAVQFCIDTLKSSVTIWKKEIFADGDSEWKENKECPWNSKSSS